MLLKNLDKLDKDGKKGDWCFLQKDTRIAIRYGEDAFKEMVILPISATGSDIHPIWAWNGNKELPTITPSILVNPVPDWNKGWHGFLIDGKLVEV